MKLNKKTLLTVVSVVLVLTMLVGGTLAYLQETSGPKTNTFNKHSVTIDLTENSGESYDIIPGTSLTKDPKISGNVTLDSYVFLEVEDNTQDLVTYAIASGWDKLQDGVYYRSVTPGDYSFDVLAGNRVTFSNTITEMDMNTANPTLTFNSYVIQKIASGVDGNNNEFTAEQAWAIVKGGSDASAAAADATAKADSVQKTAVAGSETVLDAAAAPSETMNLTRVTVPADAFAPEEGDEQPTLQIEVDTTNDLITVSGDDGTVATIDVKLLVNEAETDSSTNTLHDGKYYTVETYIAKGLHDVSLAFGNEPWDKVDSISAANQFTYDADTGKLVFTTTHFSEFVVTSSDVAYNVNKDTAYVDLQDAIDAAANGDTVNLLKDVDAETRVTIQSKTLTLDGKRKTLRASNENISEGRTLNVFGPNANVTLKNLTIVGPTVKGNRGLNIGGSNVTVVVDNCEVTCAPYYAINIVKGDEEIGLSNNLNLTISSSTISGWAAINHHGSSGNIVVKDSTLIGVNNYSGSSNNFSTIVIDGNSLFDSGSTVSNNSIVISDSTIIAQTNTECNQSWLSFQYGANNNTASVSVTGSTILDAENGADKSYAMNISGDGNAVRLPLSEDAVAIINANYMNTTSNGDGTYTVTSLENNISYFGDSYNIYAVFAQGWLENGESFSLTKDITLTADIPWNAARTAFVGNSGGTFTLTFGSYSIDLNGHKFEIPANVIIKSDKDLGDNFFSAPDELSVVKTEDNGIYTYKVQQTITGSGSGATGGPTSGPAFP